MDAKRADHQSLSGVPQVLFPKGVYTSVQAMPRGERLTAVYLSALEKLNDDVEAGRSNPVVFSM
jgi:hypothetical protein